eukprot:TRINITY_DN13296_c0_g1_i1.p1 TRINITY_DN13296_c0_g1~~TRINITY_DN13296_c0_g1_i1.p1  ORF type:complete len:261 (-),score=44.19 TRINITY_DN13296_c0_g1_i1:327-1109(-)
MPTKGQTRSRSKELHQKCQRSLKVKNLTAEEVLEESITPPPCRITNLSAETSGITCPPDCIHVTEQDLRRYGHDLEQLRRCQVIPWSEQYHPPKILPFSVAFEQACRLPCKIRDPWLGLPNPEKTREFTEADHIINEILPPSPKKLERDPDEEVEKEVEANEPPNSARALDSGAKGGGVRRMSSKSSTASSQGSSTVSKGYNQTRSGETAALSNRCSSRQASKGLPALPKTNRSMLLGNLDNHKGIAELPAATKKDHFVA